MQTVELNHLKQGDVVAVMYPISDEGLYNIITGVWMYYTQSPEEGGLNMTYFAMRETVGEIRCVTGDPEYQTRNYEDEFHGQINEDMYNDMRYFLIEPANWKVGI